MKTTLAERDLRQRIKACKAAGLLASAKALRAQLKALKCKSDNVSSSTPSGAPSPKLGASQR